MKLSAVVVVVLGAEIELVVRRVQEAVDAVAAAAAAAAAAAEVAAERGGEEAEPQLGEGPGQS